MSVSCLVVTSCDGEEPEVFESNIEKSETVNGGPDDLGPFDEPDKTDSNQEVEPLTDYIRPIITEGKVWRFKYYDRQTYYNKLIVSEEIWYVAGDTTIAGYEAKFVNCDKTHTGSIVYHSEEKIFREAMGVVYQYCGFINSEAGYKDWEPVLDMNYHPGDKYDYQFTTLLTKDVGTIVLAGKTRRVVKSDLIACHFAYEQSDEEYWVEGIGNIMGAYVHFFYPWTGMRAVRYELLACYDGKNRIFDRTEFKSNLFESKKLK